MTEPITVEQLTLLEEAWRITQVGDMHDLRAFTVLAREVMPALIDAARVCATLRQAIETALSDIECADLKCWAFTRAAMRGRPECECANCKVWRLLFATQPSTDKG